MKSQKGSVLIGVLALSIAMSLAAGGFIMLAANSANDGSAILEDRGMHYAAESGMLMGLRWLREYDTTDISKSWDDSLVLTSGADGFMALDGYQVKVKFVDDVDAGAGGIFAMKTWATAGIHRDTLELVLQINDLATPTDGLKSDLPLQNWEEIFHPGIP